MLEECQPLQPCPRLARTPAHPLSAQSTVRLGHGWVISPPTESLSSSFESLAFVAGLFSCLCVGGRLPRPPNPLPTASVAVCLPQGALKLRNRLSPNLAFESRQITFSAMKADVYQSSSQDIYLFLPQGHPFSALPQHILDQLQSLQFYKTMELEPGH